MRMREPQPNSNHPRNTSHPEQERHDRIDWLIDEMYATAGLDPERWR